MPISKAHKLVMIARTRLLLDQPFFGVLALALNLIEDPTCRTAWTDGKSLGFSPTFVESLSADELLGVIAHEVMHCACGHPWRRDAREPRQWNYAADYAINPVIVEAGMKLPSGCLLDAQYTGKSAEWIYNRLPAQPPQQQQGGKQGGKGAGQGQGQQQGQGQGNDPGNSGEVRDAPTGAQDADGSHNPTEAEWQQNVQQALKAAGRGKLPASLREKIDETTRSQVDWRSLLRRYVQEVVKSDYAWQRPNVRYIPCGLYLPALHAHACGRIAIAVDTSGSIDTVLLSQFAAEIRTIAEELQPSAVDVIYCDSRVHRVDTFERGDHVTIDAVGRGGTSFVPAFEHVAQSGDTPAVLIYLTDLDGTMPANAPDYPVIWAVYGSYGRAQSVPFGDLVPCE